MIQGKHQEPFKRFETLAELLCYLPTRQQRLDLEAFRVKYEADHGPTDLTKNYTTRWPVEQQQWMLNHDSSTREAWMQGVPPFVRAFLQKEINDAGKRGEVESTTLRWVRDYVGGHTCPPAPSGLSR